VHRSACMRGCVVTLFPFFSLFFLLLLLGVSNTKGVEIRVDISMCVCTKPKITFKLYLSVLGYLCKCRGGNRAVFPSDEFIYPYISFSLCNARTSSFGCGMQEPQKRFSSSVHCQKELNPRIHQFNQLILITSTNPLVLSWTWNFSPSISTTKLTPHLLRILLKARTKIHATTQTHLFLFSWHPIGH